MGQKILVGVLMVGLLGVILYSATLANNKNHVLYGIAAGESDAGVVPLIPIFAGRNFKDELSVANSEQAAGVMPADDFMRLMEIDSKHQMSDADLDFLLFRMDHPLQNKPMANWWAQIWVLSVFGFQKFTPQQADRVYEVTAPLLKSDFPGVRNHAARVLGNLRQKRAVPELIPLLNDANAHVSSEAHDALAELGYTAK